MSRKPVLPAKEVLDGDLVGGRKNCRVGSAPPPGLHCELQAGKPIRIGLTEGERSNGRQVEGGGRRQRHAFRVCEGALDRETHVGHPQLSLYASIAELDERVDDRLAVEHDFHGVHRHVEQPHRFDRLHPLVHQCRAVDCDLLSHVPGRVVQGLFGGHGAKRFEVEIAESAAAGREKDPSDPVALFAPEALPDRRVLAVDGAELIRHGHRRPNEMSGHDEHLFVGDGNRLPRSESIQRRPQSGGPGSAHEDKVHVPLKDHLGRREPATAGACQRVFERLILVSGPGVGRTDGRNLPCELTRVRPSRETNGPEPFGEPADDIECLTAD